MKCINFVSDIIGSLTPEQEKHLKQCRKCQTKWDDMDLDRAVVNENFDPAKQVDVDCTPKPPSASHVTPFFRKQLQEAKQQKDAAGEGILTKISTLLAKNYPSHPGLRQKFYDIAGSIKSQLPQVPDDFDERFAVALGYLSKEQTENMQLEDLVDEIKKMIDLEDGDE